MFMVDTQLIKQYWSVQDLNLGPLELSTIALTIWANRPLNFDHLAVFHNNVLDYDTQYCRPNLISHINTPWSQIL